LWIQELDSPFIHECAIQYIIQQSHGHRHHGKIEVVVAAAEIFQQANAPDINKVSEKSHGQKAEQQLVILVLKHQDPVCLEIEQDADDSGQEVRHDVRMRDFQKVFKDEEKDIVDEQSEQCVQDGHQHKPDELRLKITS